MLGNISSRAELQEKLAALETDVTSLWEEVRRLTLALAHPEIAEMAPVRRLELLRSEKLAAAPKPREEKPPRSYVQAAKASGGRELVGKPSQMPGGSFLLGLFFGLPRNHG